MTTILEILVWSNSRFLFICEITSEKEHQQSNESFGKSLKAIILSPFCPESEKSNLIAAQLQHIIDNVSDAPLADPELPEPFRVAHRTPSDSLNLATDLLNVSGVNEVVE
ncbi:hypothetical protein KIN20_034882 [Parelaphostrongylus tenuis]|uniref:Uncharacterized protein n=1 Tax=Parelaphostrongylus tenuis TaxID=148309 RepID=A0AAD5RDB5_PARTN|nr:hypothetical protein KIN20_034882 [Parelaphostrongylus tenuis]